MASQSPILTEREMNSLEQERSDSAREASGGARSSRRRRAVIVTVVIVLGAVALLWMGADRVRDAFPRFRNQIGRAHV
jgi:CHASE3 domain sensor protein